MGWQCKGDREEKARAKYVAICGLATASGDQNPTLYPIASSVGIFAILLTIIMVSNRIICGGEGTALPRLPHVTEGTLFHACRYSQPSILRHALPHPECGT